MSEHYRPQGYLGFYEPGESMSTRLRGAVRTYRYEYLDFHGLRNPEMTPDLAESRLGWNRQAKELGDAFHLPDATR